MFFGEAFICVCVFVFVSVLMQWRLSQENRCFGPFVFVFVFVFVFASDATEASMRVQMFWSLSIGGWAHWENCAALKRLEFLGELAPRPGLPASLTPTSYFLQKEKKQNRAKVFFFMRFRLAQFACKIGQFSLNSIALLLAAAAALDPIKKVLQNSS